MVRNTERTARIWRRCGCGNSIAPGDRYVESWASPDHEDLGNQHWWRLDECSDCATRYGRMTESAEIKTER